MAAKCLRCGAGNEWILGKATVSDDRTVELEAENAKLKGVYEELQEVGKELNDMEAENAKLRDTITVQSNEMAGWKKMYHDVVDIKVNLESENAGLREVDKIHTELVGTFNVEQIRLEAENAKLRKYVRHRIACEVGSDPDLCTCGLDELIGKDGK